ncbi:MAG: hypothetical protein JO225_15630 [Candidatus Eremiobacteraeota bacterium]|nr:hypothetical protein [Candidatus Eremiobacteraeota bacterium]
MGKQVAHARVVLIGAVQLEEPRAAEEPGGQNTVAFEVVDGALDDAEVFVEQCCQFARIRAFEDSEQLENPLSRPRAEQSF